MNEKNINLSPYIYGFIAGVLITGIACGIIIGRSARKIADLSGQRDQLNREYTERQRELESNVRECVGYVETARAIVERTGYNTSAAISDLREARSLIEQGIKEKQGVEMELYRLSANLHRLGNLARVQD